MSCLSCKKLGESETQKEKGVKRECKRLQPLPQKPASLRFALPGLTHPVGGSVENHVASLGRQLAPRDASCYLLLANAYRKRGQSDQARAMMAMVAKLNEEQAEKRRLAFDKNH
jgi:hypothetical protein